LSNLNVLATDVLLRAAHDRDARVRQQAVALAEPRLPNDAALRAAVVSLAADQDARVRFRVALALGGLAGDEIVPPLVSIALAQPTDAWTRTAVAAALPDHVGGVLLGVMQAPALVGQNIGAAELDLVRELAIIVGASREPAEAARVLALVVDQSGAAPAAARNAALLGLAHGLRRRGAALGDFVAALPAGADLATKLAPLFARARSAAADAGLPEASRAAAVELLAYDGSADSCDALLALALHSPAQALRVRAAEALSGHAAERIGPAIVSGFASQTPAVRRAMLDALIARPERARQLLDALEAGRVARAEIDAARAARLTGHADAQLAERARKLLAPASPAERSRVLVEYGAALSLAADPQAGRELFRRQCAACHRIAGIGVDVAPDISDSRVKTPQQLLVDILNPNQAIDNNYVSYTVVMHDGNVHTGIIAAETASAITLRQPENKTLELLRADIETIRTTGVSLMPEGLEKELTQQQLADLIAFVKHWRYLEQPMRGTGSGAK
jgi:putative heme-binding domain-containing protein